MVWSDKIRTTCLAVIPFAFTQADGSRVKPQREEWDDAMTSLVGLVEDLLQKSYRAGYTKAALDQADTFTPDHDREAIVGVCKVIADRAWQVFSKEL
jgi:hypothetical protein